MTSRIAIVGGGGGVGASLAFNLLTAPAPYDVALVDGRSGMARSHEMDLQQVVAQGATGSVEIVELAAIADADVVVISAAVPLTLNTSRMVYLRDNAAIVVAEVVATLPDGWPGVIVMVTNPVDPLCTWLQRRRGLDRRRLVGYTANDSLRLRTAIGDQLGVPLERGRRVGAGRARRPLRPAAPTACGSAARRVRSTRHSETPWRGFVRRWYERHVALDSGRSSTWTTGLGLARMVAALTGDDGELWPASVVLEGEYGVSGVALTVPVTLARGGVREVHEWPLTEEQLAEMHAAGEAVRAAAPPAR